jgi:hypothetical protein
MKTILNGAISCLPVALLLDMHGDRALDGAPIFARKGGLDGADARGEVGARFCFGDNAVAVWGLRLSRYRCDGGDSRRLGFGALAAAAVRGDRPPFDR